MKITSKYMTEDGAKAKLFTPNNEGKVCDAVVRFLEMRTGETRTDIRHPENDGVGPPVDLRNLTS